MKKTITILLTGLIVALLSACTKPSSDSTGPANNNATATNSAAPASVPNVENQNGGAANVNRPPVAAAAAANSNANANRASATETTGAPDATKMVGTYVLNQIEKTGVATLITKAKVEYVFNANGRYSRVATVNGKTINTESGEFHIDGDKLTFKIVLSGKSINKKPIEKNYTISMTPDGREVRLARNTGEVAVLKRTT